MRVAVAAGRPEFRAAVLTGMKTLKIAAAVAVLAFAGCASVPTSPSTMALPGSTKGFDQFRFDDGACRQYAYGSIGGHTAARAQEDAGARSLVAGAVIGALIGGAVTGSGHGAAVGAGVGGAAGGIAGVGAGDYSAHEAQRRYDQAYTQCMYGKGHRVAVSGHFAPQRAYAPPPAPRYYGPPPPPPPGVAVPPPPPPPGYAPR
jgi:hypothetical protein